eukprot:NODE_1460_length_1728_cov_8.716511_g1384_i0.p1 GENE.NODE_1460_length_1728_cov_8.716511_g1384_i0~~NODE_1460_length_1728_cov_8.716511_g1384_i0.p1  ORF type:complete len:475 (-),score=72.32 NODE_1460_length_1728_cov_8.716511_g1384_i0:52-1476(-)
MISSLQEDLNKTKQAMADASERSKLESEKEELRQKVATLEETLTKEKSKEPAACAMELKPGAQLKVHNAELPWDPPRCAESVSWGFLYKWKHAQEVSMCKPGGHSHAHAKSKDNIWLEFGEKVESVFPMKNIRLTKGQGGSMSTIELACEQETNVPHGQLAPKMTPFLTFRYSASLSTCSHWIDTPVMLVYRWDNINLYHTIETLTGLLQTAMVMEIDPRQMPLIFIDGEPENGLERLYWYAFKRDPALEALRGQSTVCLRNAVMAQASRTGSVFPNAWAASNPCVRAGNDMVQHMIEYVVQRMGLLGIVPPVPDATTPLKVLIINRKDTPGRVMSRKINQGHMVDLQQRVSSLRIPGKSGTIPVEASLLDLATMTLEEQIALMRRSHLLVGAHGAALVHLVFQAHERSAVLEIYPDGYGPAGSRGAGNIFYNLAAWFGRPYEGSHAMHGESLEVSSVVSLIEKQLSAIAKTSA